MGEKQQSRRYPGGLLDRWLSTVESLPGARFVRAQVEGVEAQALRHLQKRMQQVNGGAEEFSDPANGSHGSGAPSHNPSKPDSPAARLQRLIDRSLNTNPDRAEQEFYLQALGQLLPDEARILTALSDGGQVTICHVDATSRLGTHSERVLSNVSRIGVDAGVILTDNMPYYIGHLIDLGLIEIGPEAKGMESKYEMIETISHVRKTYERIENEMGMKPRLSRHTVRLSEIGIRLWQNCQHVAD